MKKVTTIAIASIFSATALFAAGAINFDQELGNANDSNLNASINFDQELGDANDSNLNASINFDQELGDVDIDNLQRA